MIDRVARSLPWLRQAAPAVPVLVYHSVGRDNGHPLWRHLTLPVDGFEAQLAWLRREGFHAVTLYDLHAHLAGGAALPERPIVLTFDDGFLDTWVYACPLLERYGFRATLFLCPAFVQAEPGVRPQATDGAAMPEAWWGYLRWDEARALLASGVFDIQAHGPTHRRHFTGPRVVDFLRPGTPHYWHRWNVAPDRQPYWLTEPYVADGDYGAPVYEHAEALLAPEYVPDAAVAERTRALVAREGGAAFFARPDWRDRLDREVAAVRTERGEQGRLEPAAEYRARVLRDLAACRDLLRARLDTRIDFFCWPANRDTPDVHALALTAGYTATTCLRRPNVPGADPTRIGRTYFGQDERTRRVGRPWLTSLRFQGRVELACGRRASYAKLFLANRLLTWFDRAGARPARKTPANA